MLEAAGAKLDFIAALNLKRYDLAAAMLDEDPSRIGPDGRDTIALHLSVSKQNVESVRWLIEHGVDIDANLINQAEANAKAAGVERRVKFLVQDAMTVDVSDATVVTLYLLSASNVKLRPILTRQLRRGARIVSHSFAMGDWEPEVVDTFRDANGTSRTLYLWTTDGKIRP